MGSEEKIKVVVRVRDLIGREKDQLKAFTTQDATDIVQKNTNKSWTFDRVYSPLDNNRTVYSDTAAEIIEQTVGGFNTTIFAYGQTSSGKTHTMHGNPDEAGVIGMAVEQLFYAVEETPDRRFLMQVSYLEIYNETVIDLLSDPKSRSAGGLRLRENEEGEVYVEGLQQKTVTSPEEIHRYMKLGEKSRHVGQTKMNDKSSRSHTIFRITLESTNRLTDDDTMEDLEEGRQVTVSQLNLVDLAGSEKTAQTGAVGGRLKEGCNINQSLMVLGQVIQKLSSGDKGHINFRDSKLTRILQNSIGGNAKTAIVCTVTPAAMSEEQTISTLRFASQAKTIQNHATVNEVLDDQAQINRLKKDMAKLMKELEQQKKDANTDMVQEMREQLERERMEKEEHIRKIKDLQEKVITSSQPAPPRKSMMLKKKDRRETWCGPAMKRNMRMSMAPHKFLKPLLPLNINLPILAEDQISGPADSLSNLSLASADFNMSHGTMEHQLDTMEARRLNEFDEMEEEEFDESVFEKLGRSNIFPISPKSRTRSVKFVGSPQFLSPRRPLNDYADLNLTDNGTPKAVIRDKYKRASIALTSREVELDMERQARLDLEREHQELQEFTRLESESGVEETRRMSMASGGSESDFVDKVKWYEKSFKDVEKLNLDLGKELSETKQNCCKLKLTVEDLTDQLETVSKKEETSTAKLIELSPLVLEVKKLRETTSELEKHKMDFEMQLELAVGKKETAITDLRKYLDSAYGEIATLENGSKVDVRDRFEKMRELGLKVEKLEEECKSKDGLLEEAENMKEELEGLKEGMEVVTAEMVKLSEDKVALEDEVKSLQASSVNDGNPEILVKLNNQEVELSRVEGLLRSKIDETSNLELSNASLLETVDDLSRKTEEIAQKNSELLVTSAELQRFNLELNEEIGQLKVELRSVIEVKDKIEIDNQEMKVALEEARTSKTDQEELINRSKNTDEMEAMQKELKQMEEDKAKLEALLIADERSIMINKLSATLNCIEESFIAVEDSNKTCADESPGNATFASAGNTTFGVPLEVVEEMKNQLLFLQQQLINFSPEELNRKIEELKSDKSKLKEKIEEMTKSSMEDEKSITDHYDKVLEEREETLKVKHKAEIAIISTKMQEEMNFNIPALEERLRVEYEEKRQEAAKVLGAKFEDEHWIKDEELKNGQLKIVELEEQLKNSQAEVMSARENLSSQKNTTLGVGPGQRVESLYTTASEEISFDDTLGSGSMNITMENTVFSGGVGDSLQVQMLKGELEMVKNSLEERDLVIENLKGRGNDHELESSLESAHELNNQEELELLKKTLEVKSELIEELQKLGANNLSPTENGTEKSLKKESAEMEEKVAEYQKTIYELKTQLSEFIVLKSTGEDYIRELKIKTDKYEEVVEKNDELEDTNEDLKRKIEEGMLQFESLNSNIDALTEQIKSLEDLVEIKSREVECLTEVQDSHSKLLVDFEMVSVEANNMKAALEIQVQENEILSDKAKAAEEVADELESFRLSVNEKINRIEELNKLLQDSEKNMSDLGNIKSDLEVNMEVVLAEKKDLVDQLETYKNDVEDVALKNRNLEEGLENAMSDLESAIIEKETVQELSSQYESKISELTEEINVSTVAQEELKSACTKLGEELDAVNSQNGVNNKKNLQLVLEIDNHVVDAKRFKELKEEMEEKMLKLDENVRALSQEKENEKLYFEKCLQDSKSDSTLVSTISSKLSEMEARYDEEVASKSELESHYHGLLDKLKDEKSSLEKHLNFKETEFTTDLNEKEAVIAKLDAEKALLHDELTNTKSKNESNMKLQENKIIDLESSLKVQLEDKRAAEVTLQNKIDEGIVAEGEKTSLLQERATSEAIWESKLKEKADDEVKVLSQLEDLTNEMAFLKSELNVLEEKQSASSDHEQQIENLQRDFESLKSECVEVESQRDKVNEECDNLEAKLNEAEESLKIEMEKKPKVNELQNQILVLSAELKKNVQVVEEHKLLQTELCEANTKLETNTHLRVKIDDLENQVVRLKYDLSEAERLRDMVDAECDKLESELEETKVKLVELNTSQDAESEPGQPSSLQSTMIAGQQTLLNNVSMDCTFIPPREDYGKLKELEIEKEHLLRELNDLKRQLASSPTEEKYVNLKTQLIKQKDYSDRMFEENKELKCRAVKSQEDCSTLNAVSSLEEQLAEVKEDLGNKNIEYASLKVDVERGELQYKKKCEILQADLDYEKTNSTRLTLEIRRFQSSAMDTTVITHKPQTRTAEVSSAACNTSATTAGSPVWSSGSGAIKEIRLHSAEMRVKSLEKENSKLKEHEEFYINKAREWKSRALKYEKTLEKNGVTVPSKENRRETTQGGAANISTAAKPQEKVDTLLPAVDPATAKVYQAAGLSPRTSANPLQDLQNLRTEAGPAPPTPTEDIKLVLSRRSEARRTEEDFRLPNAPSRGKPDDCKTQ